MALITCPECGKDVSDQAEACPHCGHPMNSQKPSQGVEKSSSVSSKAVSIGLKAFGTLLLLGGVVGCSIEMQDGGSAQISGVFVVVGLGLFIAGRFADSG